MRANPTLSPRHARRNLPALEKPNDDYYLTKTILRSYGYGLSRKRPIFPAHTEDRPSAPKWARLGVSLLCRRLVVPRGRERQVRASSFLDFPWLIRARANRHAHQLERNPTQRHQVLRRMERRDQRECREADFLERIFPSLRHQTPCRRQL